MIKLGRLSEDHRKKYDYMISSTWMRKMRRTKKGTDAGGWRSGHHSCRNWSSEREDPGQDPAPGMTTQAPPSRGPDELEVSAADGLGVQGLAEEEENLGFPTQAGPCENRFRVPGPWREPRCGSCNRLAGWVQSHCPSSCGPACGSHGSGDARREEKVNGSVDIPNWTDRIPQHSPYAFQRGHVGLSTMNEVSNTYPGTWASGH